MKNKYVLSLREVLSKIFNDSFEGYNDVTPLMENMGGRFYEYLQHLYPLSAQMINNYTQNYGFNIRPLNNYVHILFDMVGVRYYDDSCVVLYDLNDFEKEAKKLFDNLINIACMTFNKYSKLLSLYDAEQNNLLKAVQTSYTDSENYNGQTTGNSSNSSSGSNSGNSQLNDTPQSADDEFSNDDFATQITKSQDTSSLNEIGNTSATSAYIRSLTHISNDERESIIARLDEIERKYQLLYKKWTEEFDSLFWDGGTYE